MSIIALAAFTFILQYIMPIFLIIGLVASAIGVYYASLYLDKKGKTKIAKAIPIVYLTIIIALPKLLSQNGTFLAQ